MQGVAVLPARVGTLVIGGGVAGVSLAHHLALRTKGHETVLVIDRVGYSHVFPCFPVVFVPGARGMKWRLGCTTFPHPHPTTTGGVKIVRATTLTSRPAHPILSHHPSPPPCDDAAFIRDPTPLSSRSTVTDPPRAAA